jgi:ERCC4-related helicase
MKQYSEIEMNRSLAVGSNVSHVRHGQGELLFIRGETAVVRFAHGLEELLISELDRTINLKTAIETSDVSPFNETILRAQSAAIRSVNDSWGVFSRSRISLLPHQLWVCHQTLRQWPIRMLIADDVGMGKTVEAGLILWPLLAKGAIRRLLVLTPAKLVEQWQERLRQMFDIRLAIYSPEVDNPRTDFWNTHPMVVASLPTLRSDSNGRHERLLDAPEWDMVIVDEAHHLNAEENGAKTLGLQLMENMQELGKINSCILFTGTPHRGKDYGFWSLMGLLDKDKFGPRKATDMMLNALPNFLIRNAKQKATDMAGNRLFQPIRQYPETFSYTPEETEFYQLLSSFILAGKAYASSLSKAQRGQVILVLIALQKLASSSIAAVRAALETRQARMSGLVNKYRSELELESDDPSADELDRALSEWSREDRRGKIRLMEDEANYLNELLIAARAVTLETRVTRVVEIIESRFPDQQVLLFTEYKRTQALVVSALIARFGMHNVGFINGDNRLDGIVMPDGQVVGKGARREDTCDAFNEGRIRFLVSTEAGGEGIDLQERCSALIHVDLPWNPMRLHQRVGRLNRYGQKKVVEVVSLRNPDTVEAMIWDKLETKLASIMQALGTAMDEPEDLLQLVLGMTSPGFFDELFDQAAEVPKERLAEWFNEQSRTFGGESAINTIKTLVGHAQSFDLSGLQDVPPMDLPDLKPFFSAALGFNGRRPKYDDGALSFKTPEKWLDHPAIKRDYKDMFFDRLIRGKGEGDLVGVGHPLLTRAMDQADRLKSVFSVVHGLQHPILLLLVTDRVTDSGVHVRVAVLGAIQGQHGIEIIKDWELLRLLNQIETSHAKELNQPINTNEVDDWVRKAKTIASERLFEFKLPFAVPDLRDFVLLWPSDTQ